MRRPDERRGNRHAKEQQAQRTAYLTRAGRRRPERFWHGGTPGMQPGSLLLSRMAAEASGTDLTRYAIQTGYGEGVTSPERVYFSSDREFARAFAALNVTHDPVTGVVVQTGTLYEVEPLGPVEHDPDFANGGVSWCAPTARVLAIEEPDVLLDPYAVTETIGPYMAWSDGSPIYTRAGQILPSPEQKAARSHPMLQALIPWTPVHFINSWVTGSPPLDRPNPGQHSGILIGARGGGEVWARHTRRATALLRQGIDYRSDSRVHLDDINDLLAQTSNVHLSSDDMRGVLFAAHPSQGVLAAAVITASQSGAHVAMFLDTISVAPDWRGRGLGSTLLLTAQRLLPAPPAITVGHVRPDIAPFFARSGYTVLRPGLDLPFTLGAEPVVLHVDDDCWFYRQGRL